MKRTASFKYPSQFVIDLLRFIGYTISKTVWFIRYEGRKNIPPNDSQPFLIVANHQTYVDPVWACLPMRRRIRYMAVGSAFTWRYVGSLIRYLGAFPVAAKPSGSIGAMKESLKTLRNGAVLVIFPEGTREFADGAFLEFKTGAVRIAVQAKVPILPVTISGGNRIWPQKQKYPKLFRQIKVTYHPLVDLIEKDIPRTDEELEQITQMLKLIISDEPVRP